tara:strand:- start:368 stop:823 length:456 start_codon:yes stop_codon:yes gene_type:complete
MIDGTQLAIYASLLLAGHLLPKIIGYQLFKRKMKKMLEQEEEEDDDTWPRFNIYITARSTEKGFIERIKGIVDVAAGETMETNGYLQTPCEHNEYARMHMESHVRCEESVDRFANEMKQCLSQEKNTKWSLLIIKQHEWGGATAYRSETTS